MNRLHQVGVLELRGHHGLAKEHPHLLGIARRIVLEHLHRDVLRKAEGPHLTGQVHVGHAPRGDAAFENVPTELEARGDGGLRAHRARL